MDDKTLMALAAGALLGGVVQACVRRYEAFAESRGIAAALAAEAGAVIGFARHREYLNGLAATIRRLEDQSHIPTHNDCFDVSVTQDYFAVFHSVAPKIGTLGPLAREVVALYTRTKGVIEDLMELRRLKDKILEQQLKPQGEPRITLDREGLLGTTKDVHAILESVLRDGPALVARLEHYVGRRWLGIFP
jgi:hypothetical protein